MPLWATILCVCVNSIGAVGVLFGVWKHMVQKAQADGKTQLVIEQLCKSVELINARLESCQQIERCESAMTALSARVDNVHRRLDEQDARQNLVEAGLSELRGVLSVWQQRG